MNRIIPHVGGDTWTYTGDRADIDKLIATLKRVLDNAIGGVVTDWMDQGICAGWACEYAGVEQPGWEIPFRLLSYFATDWEHTRSPGKLVNYPIKHTEGFGKWEGPNLTMRVSLIRYVLKRLRDWRRRTPA